MGYSSGFAGFLAGFEVKAFDCLAGWDAAVGMAYYNNPFSIIDGLHGRAAKVHGKKSDDADAVSLEHNIANGESQGRATDKETRACVHGRQV